MLLTRAFDRATAHDALGVGKQHHLQEHGRWIRRSARVIILNPGVEVRQIDVVIEQVIQRMLERARQQLTG